MKNMKTRKLSMVHLKILSTFLALKVSLSQSILNNNSIKAINRAPTKKPPKTIKPIPTAITNK